MQQSMILFLLNRPRERYTNQEPKKDDVDGRVYIDNCINPGDPESFEMWIAGHAQGMNPCGELEDDGEDACSKCQQLRRAYRRQIQSVQCDRRLFCGAVWFEKD